ncbi:GntR family transcriptional regulator [Stappia taiwanensis]|uniref:GntR family transcriptional regulator n=1 Tax=Stappia taiwanensis TaxID=992267 RepID=A0A838Y337_9HYPH|nr:GntR family transcriptional regulator [Stappia taiwanensis]MBA4613383.1 GntR family transcriptional regulator [Stappia taiwanensis]GGE82140.1 transcriptional regulator [Stappia taiwanensis]
MAAELFTKDESPAGLAAQRIHDCLCEEILAGELAPGTRLGEVALAKRFDVSRGPIRAALKMLAETGVVTVVPHSGARVREMSYDDARALYQVREALEAQAASLAAASASAEAVAQLRAVLAGHSRDVAAHPTGAYLQGGSDRDFHNIVARMAGNAIIQRYLTKELYPQLALLRVRHTHVTGRGVSALREHERIVEAIAAGDSEVAGLLMRRHIQNSWASLEAQLKSDDA